MAGVAVINFDISKLCFRKEIDQLVIKIKLKQIEYISSCVGFDVS